MDESGRRRSSYANVTATVALFIALGGGAYAATTAPKDSVTSKSVRNGSLKGKDVRSNSLTSAEIEESSLGVVPAATRATSAAGVAANSITGASVVDNSLGGGDIDESSLSLPAAPDEVTPISARIGPSAPFQTLYEGNGLRLEGDCAGALGDQNYRVDLLDAGILQTENQFPALNPALNTFSGPANDVGSVGLGVNGQAHTNYFFRRASDGRTVTISLGATNANSAGLIGECVYAGTAAAE